MFVKSINQNPGDMQHTVRRCQNNDKETNYIGKYLSNLLQAYKIFT